MERVDHGIKGNDEAGAVSSAPTVQCTVNRVGPLAPDFDRMLAIFEQFTSAPVMEGQTGATVRARVAAFRAWAAQRHPQASAEALTEAVSRGGIVWGTSAMWRTRRWRDDLDRVVGACAYALDERAPDELARPGKVDRRRVGRVLRTLRREGPAGYRRLCDAPGFRRALEEALARWPESSVQGLLYAARFGVIGGVMIRCTARNLAGLARIFDNEAAVRDHALVTEVLRAKWDREDPERMRRQRAEWAAISAARKAVAS